MATIQIKRGLQSAVQNLVLAQGELAVALDTGNVYVGTQTGTVHVNPSGGTADTASKLQTPRNFSITGDGTAQAVPFDGTDNVQLQFVLANISALSAGTYTKVTVNAKGQVTMGQQIVVSDLPEIPVSKISGLGTAATANKGVAGGVAELGSDGKVPASQLPSYVDDVKEYANRAAFPETGEDGVIYVAEDTNLTYRWSGTQYVEISPSLALGETSSTAYRGDHGKTAYDHSQITSGNPHGTTFTDVGAAPASHVEVKASASQLGHIKAGTDFSVGSDGTLSLANCDGGTF